MAAKKKDRSAPPPYRWLFTQVALKAISNGTVILLVVLYVVYVMVKRAPADEMLEMLRTVFSKYGLGYGLATVITGFSGATVIGLRRRLDACNAERSRLQEVLIDRLQKS